MTKLERNRVCRLYTDFNIEVHIPEKIYCKQIHLSGMEELSTAIPLSQIPHLLPKYKAIDTKKKKETYPKKAENHKGKYNRS